MGSVQNQIVNSCFQTEPHQSESLGEIDYILEKIGYIIYVMP